MLNASVTACSSSIGYAAANGDRARTGRGRAGGGGSEGEEKEEKEEEVVESDSVRGAARTDAVDADADGPLDGLVGG